MAKGKIKYFDVEISILNEKNIEIKNLYIDIYITLTSYLKGKNKSKVKIVIYNFLYFLIYINAGFFLPVFLFLTDNLFMMLF